MKIRSTITSRRGARRLALWVLLPFLLVLLLLLVAGFAVAPLLKWQVESRGTAALGRQVSVESVRFRPWSLALDVEGIRVAGAPRAGAAGVPEVPEVPPALTVGRLRADLALASLWHLSPVVRALEVDTLRLRLARLAPGRYDIDDVLRRLAPDPARPASGDPLRFAVSNLQLRDAAIRFDDRPSAQVHEITRLQLAVPFVSNLPAQMDVKVEPRLAFRLDGVAFDSTASTTPFAVSRAGDATLHVAGLDLAPYLGYLPDALPLRLRAATLSADVTLRFALPPHAPPELRLHGSLDLRNVQLADAAGAPLLGWRRLEVAVRDAAPLARRIELGLVRLDGARLALRRGADGSLNVVPKQSAGRAAAAPAAPVSAPAATAAKPATAAPAPDWQVRLDRFVVDDGSVAWNDDAVQPAAALQIDALAGELAPVEWPLKRSAALRLQGRLAVRGAAAATALANSSATGPATVSVDGTVGLDEARLALSVTGLPLAALDPYVAQALVPRLDGRVTAQGRLDWADARAPRPGVRLTVDTATVDAVSLRERGSAAAGAAPTELASLGRLAIHGAQVDVASRSVDVGRLVIDTPALTIARGRDGRFDVSRWLVTDDAGTGSTTSNASNASNASTGRSPHNPGTSPRAARPAATAPRPWRVQLRDTQVAAGRLRFDDALPTAPRAEPVRLAVSELRIAVQNLAWEGSRPTVPAQIELQGRVGPPQAVGEPTSRDAGSFDWRGVVGIEPLLLIGSLKVERAPVHLLMPYLSPGLPLRVAHAEFGYAGNLSVKQLPGGVDVDAGTDLLLGAVRLESAAPTGAGETLMSWNTLSFKSVRLSVKPGARPQVDVAEAALDNFFARLVVTEQGRLNLSSLAGSKVDGGGQGGPAVAPPTASAALSPAASAESSSPPPRLVLPFDFRLGGTALTNGRIDFSDHFVKPNYSAALTELAGRLGALSSGGGSQMASLAVKGKAAGTALLDVTGEIDPFARPLALDLHAKATDLELAPLSPYAGKYAGYAIERGKLSMDVTYRLRPDGRLDASNRVVLNQLTFGKRIESPTATRLPVLLAVALLKDRHGVIDLDLPISGSLEDPQFSVAGVIGRLLGNLLLKALTSPFALLSSGFGGGSGGAGGGPGRVEFEPGTSRLAASGTAAIEQVARALADKPGLLLTVTGAADPQRERDAYRAAVLGDRLDAAGRKRTVESAAAASAPAPALGTDARNRLLAELYRDTDLPDKPRNALGFARSLPPAEMEARLRAAVVVDDDAMRDLALQRGVGVRDALIGHGLASERLFLAAPRLETADAAATAPWVPQALLALTVR